MIAIIPTFKPFSPVTENGNENKRFCEVVKKSLKMYILARKLAREEDERKIEQGKIKLCELSEQLEDILSSNY